MKAFEVRLDRKYFDFLQRRNTESKVVPGMTLQKMVSLEARTYGDYTVGWISALPLEMTAAKLMLDKKHSNLPSRQLSDHNNYALGEIAGHNVVIACLPSGVYGTTSAAVVAEQMLSTFPNIRFGLLVGIGGGVPSSLADIRLGDIVISKPVDGHGGVVQYDYGKTVATGKFHRTGSQNRPPDIVLTAIAHLESEHILGESLIPKYIQDVTIKHTYRGTFGFPEQGQDRLFQATYNHETSSLDCGSCDHSEEIVRSPRYSDNPHIHYGLIASGNQVMKHGETRNRLAQELGILCFEMEAAGLINNFPCLVIRGISDYSDSHKNKRWQGYAAIAAAAYAKELLTVIPTTAVDTKCTAKGATNNDEFRVPFDLTAVPVVNKFVGRSADLDQIWAALQSKVSNLRKVLILHGTGGMGKTQLAIHFARRYKGKFTAVFWINGQDEKILIRSLASIVTQIHNESENLFASNIPENEEELRRAARHVLDWLSQENNSNWLLIYDNVDQYLPCNSDNQEVGGYDIRKYFPSADHGSIIITTRSQHLIEIGTSSYLLGPLPINECLDLLVTCANYSTQQFIPPGTDEAMRELADRLDGLPLAIVLAGSFIRRTGISFQKYLYLYNQEWPHLQAAAESQSEYSHGNILAAWALSYNQIKNTSPSASQLLYLLSFFHNNDIWFELIQNGNRAENQPAWFSEIVSNEIVFLKTIGVLMSFSLVQRRLDMAGYYIHPVVQDWCQHALPKMDVNLEKATKANSIISAVAVAHSITSSSEKDYWIQQQRLLPHIGHILSNLDVSGYSYTQVSLLDSVHLIGNLYRDQGIIQGAERMYQLALEGRERTVGLDDPSTLETINSLGVVYTDQDKLQEAETMLQRALRGYEKILGPDHVSTLKATSNLGLLYGKQGKLQEAEKMHMRALFGKERMLGLDHISTLDTVGNLGNVYFDQGRMPEAERSYQRALRGYEKALGPDHTSTLLAVNNLGGVYRNQGRLKEAEMMYQRALSGHEKTLGTNHMSTFMAANNLGNVYFGQGKVPEAERSYQRALRGYKKALGPDHTSTLSVLNNLESLYRNQGQLKKVKERDQEVLRDYEKEKGHGSEISQIGRYMLRSRNRDKKALPQQIPHSPASIFPSKSSKKNSGKDIKCIRNGKGQGKKVTKRKQGQKTRKRRDVSNSSSLTTHKQGEAGQTQPRSWRPELPGHIKGEWHCINCCAHVSEKSHSLPNLCHSCLRLI